MDYIARSHNRSIDGPSASIRLVGVAEHNLKNLTLSLPRGGLMVLTGPSGSGKSTLAIDTIYAEGRRRYVASLSPYARQYLEPLPKPHIEHIAGLPPTIAIEPRRPTSNPRSTVSTSTELHDFLRLLFSRIATPICWLCNRPIVAQPATQIVDSILSWPENTRIQICAPVIRGQKGEHRDIFTQIQRQGFVRARVDGVIYDIKNVPKLDKNKKHDIAAVVDRLILKDNIRVRLADSIETALKIGDGLVLIMVQTPEEKKDNGGEGQWRDVLYSEKYACPEHPEVSLPELSPRLFSFNSPYGACPACDGLGTIPEFDPDLIVPDKNVSLEKGAIEAWRKGGKRMNIYYNRLISRFCRQFGISKSEPFSSIPAPIRQILLYGTTPEDESRYGISFEGVIPNLRRRWENTESEFVKERLHGYLSESPCKVCKGTRLRPEATAVLLNGKNISEITSMTVREAHKFFSELPLDPEQSVIAEQPLQEIRGRLQYLLDVGLGYLTLDRPSRTLSGGEAQRIHLAAQLGSGLVGCCYVLDEPTIGLHHRDNERLLKILKQLRDIGNTVLVVEHDEEIIRQADYIVDIGPGAGRYGGEIVAAGTVEDICRCPRSLTGQYLSGAKRIELPAQRRKVKMSSCIEVRGAAEHNLKDINVKFPLGVMTCVTGVSGSGKSTLINEVLLKGLKRRLYGSREKPGKHKNILGISHIDKVIEIDQSPIGRTPRSNPATYTGVFDLIRQLFAMTREARLRGYKPGRFSFNVKGGRCEACQGQGTRRIEMHFLPDVYVTCQTCQGKRYNPETLQITYKGKNISDVLDMEIDESRQFFANFPKILHLIKALCDVGLGYMTLGQSSTTMSGGEAQRVKLAAELGKPSTGHTLYILDEPTTGLHFADIDNLITVLRRLTDMGNTVIVIEHNLDVIKMADYIIDLGPEGGDEGGWVIAEGTPEEIIKNTASHTARYLREKLAQEIPPEPQNG